MKCSVYGCPVRGDADFDAKCADHFLEWIATLDEDSRIKALGPPLIPPRVIRFPIPEERRGNFIFFSRG